jgi:uncharacterized membrane protein
MENLSSSFSAFLSSLPPFAFSRPEFLSLFGLLPLFWLLQWRSLRSLGGFLSLLLHSLVVCVLILAAAGLHGLRPGRASVPLLAFDVSHSLTRAQREWMHETALQQLKPTPDTPTLLFAGSRQWLAWKEVEPLLLTPPTSLQLEESNLESALTGVLEESPNRSIYLLSDGWEAAGSAAPLLPLLAKRQQRLYPFPPPGVDEAPNIAIQRIGAPQTIQKGDSFDVSVALENTNPVPVQGELVLRQKEQVVWQKQVTLSPGASVFTHALKLPESGLIPLRASFTPAAGTQDVQDARSEDNQAAAWVRVNQTDKVLLLSARERDNRYLEQALTDRGLDVRSVNFSSRSTTVPAPESFSTVILNNVAKNKLPPAMLNRLRTYVQNGGGLIMVGGEESLGLGGYKDTPIEQALPISLTPPQKEEKRTAVMLVIDKSGSMRQEHRLLYAKSGVRGVARNLKNTDLFGVIGFDREPFSVIPLSYMGKIRNDIDGRIGRLKAAGGTYLMPALQEAKRQLERQPATRKHLIILTDGETGGSGSDYLDLVSVMHQELKMTISTIAVGQQPNLRLLSRLAEYGGGAFHHTTDPASLPDLFIGELEEKDEEKTMVEKDLTPIPNRGSPLLKELAQRGLPKVKGYIESQLKKGARSDVSLRVNGSQPPLLASWSYGQGKAVAFTSDVNGRWSAPWISWDGFSTFWEQVVRWCFPKKAKQDKKSDFAVELGHNEDGLVIDVFSYGSQEKGRSAVASIRRATGVAVSLPLDRLAPGHYQGMYTNTQPGDYRVEITLPSGETLGPLGYTLPALRQKGEVPQPQPNMALLETLAQTTGGSVNPDVDSLLQPVSEPEQQPFLPYLIPLAMGLYLLELLVRRMA